MSRVRDRKEDTPSECCNYNESFTHQISACPSCCSESFPPTFLCTAQVWMSGKQSSTVLVHNIESKYCVYREQKIVSNLTRYDVQYSFKHLITFALSQARSQLEMSRWHVPCWPSNWTTSWVENPSSTDTFRDTKPQSSLLSFPEGSATRWGSLISFTAFIYCKNKKSLEGLQWST